MNKDERIYFRISAKTKQEFLEALEYLNDTISGRLIDHIEKDIQKIKRHKKEGRIID